MKHFRKRVMAKARVTASLMTAVVKSLAESAMMRCNRRVQRLMKYVEQARDLIQVMPTDDQAKAIAYLRQCVGANEGFDAYLEITDRDYPGQARLLVFLMNVSEARAAVHHLLTMSGDAA